MLLFAQEPVVEAMAVVEQIVGRHDGHEEQHQQDDGNRLVGLRLLHRQTIVAQGVVCRHLLEELCVDAVVVTIELPLMESQCRNGTLIAHVKNDMIVGADAVVEPLDLRCYQ